MTKPKPTTYSIVAITMVAECPWCDSENEIEMNGNKPNSEVVHECNYCCGVFTLDNGD